MQIKIRSPRRLCSGLLVVAFGIAGVWFASSLKFGVASAMGPGFLPTICSWLIVLLGMVELCKALQEDFEVIEPMVPRPVFMIFLSIGLFAFLIERAGLGITVLLTALVASHAAPVKPIEALILAVAAAVGVTLVFVILLGLPIPVWPEFN